MGWGGQETRVFVELEWMRARGHWVALAAHPESAIAKRASDAGITFYPLRTHKALLPLEIVRLAAWLVANRVDIVNTHSSNDGWLAGIASRLAFKTLIRSRHIEVDYPNKFWSGVAFRVLPRYIITTSQLIANRLIKELDVSPDRVSCISTGVDLTKFQVAVLPQSVAAVYDRRLPPQVAADVSSGGAFSGPQSNSNLRTELNLTPDTALVGMISVLRSWKGHATFLEAAAQLLQSSKRPIRFVIAGDGPGRQELTDKIAQEPWKDRVTLLGHRNDVPNVLAALDVLVLPSYAHEGIPQIVLQAQAMARPVVATTVGGIPEVVEDNVTGLLVPPRDANALAEKISAVLEDPVLAKRLGQAARESIVKHHSIDSMGERLLALYESLRS
jgi:glycosyltransferase involved in cell wall biosynthesis